MRKFGIIFGMLASLGMAATAHAGADRTTYPVVFAHGLGGFDNILGYDYWGDDYGAFVGDACDKFLEIQCNGHLNSGQKTFVAAVMPIHNSEVRGLDLADDIEGFLATAGTSRVNLIGHSQGGFDIRKAARVLYERHGYNVVQVLISVSSPHRGSPVAQYILNLGDGVTSVLDALFRFYGGIVYAPGNDGIAAAKSLVYDDFDPNDGQITGARAFNQAYPVDSRYAARYASLITAQNGLSVNPALYLVTELFFDIDGDGFCIDDCDGDGAAGSGDGRADEADDDGLVGINSQQMGYRLRYSESLFGFDQVNTDFDRGFVGALNAPNAVQMTSMASVISQDHVDVIGIGPDTFDEMEFYAAIIDYIAAYD
ncbi:esterase/lipase family protein [Haliangium sp.]|uniref:esterase/lipase family protein n=1 Tax=Haliangium sp. TaxID=2663208 RepID=UPI003D095D1C